MEIGKELEKSGAVGFQFVRQYYTILNKDPSRLHCFYKNASFYTHGAYRAIASIRHGQFDIDGEIRKQGYSNCKVEVETLDAQPSRDGVMVMVVGKMSFNPSLPPSPFSQSFFLVQEQEGRYYVLNDIFRLLDQESSNISALNESLQRSSIQETRKEGEMPVPNVSSSAPSEIPEKAEAKAVSPPVSAPAPVPEKTPALESTPEPVAAPPPAKEESSPPSPPSQKESASPRQSAWKANSKPQEFHQKRGRGKGKEETRERKEKAKEGHEDPSVSESEPNQHAEEEEDSNDPSAFLKNVTEEMDKELREYFSQYGDIVRVKYLGKSAFMDFKTAQAAQAAIKGAPTTIRNTKVIAQRRAKPRTLPNFPSSYKRAFSDSRPHNRDHSSNRSPSRPQSSAN